MKWPSLERKPETVKGAVVRYGGENFCDTNHQLALDKVKVSFPDYALENEQARGWLTSRGRIVSEEEAKEIDDTQRRRTGEDTTLMRDPESTLFKEKNE